MNPRTLLVMAGGTGGHIYPGIAVAEELAARGWEIAWLGNPDGMEATIVPAHGWRCEWIRFGALRGKGVVRKLLLPLNLLTGFWQAWRALSRVKPDVVLGMGGYISFPGGMMAALTGRPLVLHEQNSIAGLANRVLAKVADCVLTGFPDALPKSRWVGNPVRREITRIAPPEERFAAREGALSLLVVGGSRGALALNDVVPKALAKMPASSRPRVTHQSGRMSLDALRTAYAEAGVEGELLEFIDDMQERYAAADLVLCRSGAITVAELAAVGVASVLVPFPHAVDDHQTHNARFLSEREAGVLLPQSECSAEKLAELLLQLDRAQLAEMAGRARALARPDAAVSVADACEALVVEKKT